MSGFALQGIACDFGKCFPHGNDILHLKSDCFESCSETDVRLLLDHEGKSLGTTADKLEVYMGADALAFRYTIPDSWSEQFSEPADDLNTYLPVSVGFKFKTYETVTIDGVKVKIIGNATLNEISVLRGEPAIKATYARVVSLDSCNSLEDDFERIKLIGRYVSLHRKTKSRENGGKVNYSHATSPYDKAATRFERALQSLMK